MSYEGYAERLCLNGHYSAHDVYCEASRLCECGAPIRYSHGVDQTNGYDESHPSSCDAPKREIGRENVWHKDHLGNAYATERKRYQPAGRRIWIKVNSQGNATPPYPDDLALETEARRAETVKQGSVHEGAGPKDSAQ